MEGFDTIKVEVKHRQVCLPGMLDCEDTGGSPGGVRRASAASTAVEWTEEFVATSADDFASINLDESLEAAKELKVKGQSAVGDGDWVFTGLKEEEGIEYHRYELQLELTSGLEKQWALVEAGILPDLWVYLESADKRPCVLRYYSTFNDNKLYGESIFAYAEPLSNQEQGMGKEEVLEEMVYNNTRRRLVAPQPAMPEARDLGFSLQDFGIEFPDNCLASSSSPMCFAAYKVQDGETGVCSLTLDAALRDPRGNEAQLQAVILLEKGQLKSVSGVGSGCANYLALQVGDLAKLGATLCFDGEISYTGGQVQGQLSFSGEAVLSAASITADLEMNGYVNVKSQQIGGVLLFAGLQGYATAQGSAPLVAYGVELSVSVTPMDLVNTDNFKTSVLLTPSVEINLGIYRHTYSPTFQLGNVGPTRMAADRQPSIKLASELRSAATCPQSKHGKRNAAVFVNFELPETTVGQQISFSKGSYGKKVSGNRCSRIVWTPMTFTCQPDGTWLEQGRFRTDSNCFSEQDRTQSGLVTGSSSCASKSFNKQTAVNFVSFQMPKRAVGAQITVPQGQYVTKKNAQCHRIVWPKLTFRCGSNGQWQSSGGMRVDSKCFGNYNAGQKYLKVGTKH